MFDKLDDIIYEPIKMLTDWAREPLKGREHQRKIENDKLENDFITENEKIKHINQIEASKLAAELSIKTETEKAKIFSEIKIHEMETEVDLNIRKETEKHKILVEIDEFRKDREFERMKLLSDALMSYKEKLTEINVNTIMAIGNMQLELREKAQNLIYDKTIKYKELQDIAMNDAMRDLTKIDKEFGYESPVGLMLTKAVDQRLCNVINTAQNFLLELNNDIRHLNESIDRLTDSGQKFIDRHLDDMRSINSDKADLIRLSNYPHIDVD